MSLARAAGYTITLPVCLAALTSMQRLTLASLGFSLQPGGVVEPDYITVLGDGADVGIRFGTSTVDVTLTAVSTVVAEAVTENVLVPHQRCPSGTERRFMVPPGCTHLAFISASATGYVRLAKAS
jgi:hypothetical protein